MPYLHLDYLFIYLEKNWFHSQTLVRTFLVATVKRNKFDVKHTDKFNFADIAGNENVTEHQQAHL